MHIFCRYGDSVLGKSENQTFDSSLIYWAKGEIYKINDKSYHNRIHSEIHFPFLICGFIAIGNSVVIILIYIFLRPKDITTCIHLYVKHDISSAEETDLKKRKPWFHKGLCTYLFICCLALSIKGAGSEFYIFPVAILSGLDFIVTDASIFTMVFHFLVAVSRILTGFILKYINIRKTIIVSMSLSAISGGLLAFIGFKSYILFWILACLLSFFFGNAYPCHMALVNSYVKMSGFMVSLTDMGLSVSIFITVWASGALLDFVGPQAVLIEFWLGVCVCLIITICVNIIGDSVEKQILTEDNKTEDSDETYPLFS